MGIAIIASGVSFADANLGKVTAAEVADLASISISGAASVDNNKNSSSYVASYMSVDGMPNVPAEQKGVIWSILSGASYASISNTGVLSVLATGTVTIKVASTYNENIFATKEVSCVYNDAPFWLVGYTDEQLLTAGSNIGNRIYTHDPDKLLFGSLAYNAAKVVSAGAGSVVSIYKCSYTDSGTVRYDLIDSAETKNGAGNIEILRFPLTQLNEGQFLAVANGYRYKNSSIAGTPTAIEINPYSGNPATVSKLSVALCVDFGKV